MRWLGNFGASRVGATAGAQFYWNRRWTINYRAASATLTKTVRLSAEDLAALTVRGSCEAGSLILTMSQGDTTRELDLVAKQPEKFDTAGLEAGELTLKLTAKSAKKVRVRIDWRR